MSGVGNAARLALLALGFAGGAVALLGPSLAEPDVCPPLAAIDAATGRVLDAADPLPAGSRVRLPADALACRGLPAPAGLEGDAPVMAQILAAAEAWYRDREPAALQELGEIYVAMEEHRAALEAFAAAAALAPSDAAIAYRVGITAQRLGQDDLAMRFLERASETGSGNPTIEARMGDLHLGAGDLDAAEDAFGEAVSSMPSSSPVPYVGLGRVAMARGDLDGAIRQFRTATVVAPQDFRARRLLGTALARNGRDEAARRALAMADRLPAYAGWLQFDPEMQAVYARVATQRHLEGEIVRAEASGSPAARLAAIGRLLERRPEDGVMHAFAARAHLDAGDITTATESAAIGLRFASDDVEVRLVACAVALAGGAHADALAHAEAAVALDGGSAEAHEARGRSLLLLERPAEAVAALMLARDLDPARAVTRLVLSAAHEATGDLEAAIDAARTAIDLSGDPRLARNIVARLERERERATRDAPATAADADANPEGNADDAPPDDGT